MENFYIYITCMFYIVFKFVVGHYSGHPDRLYGNFQNDVSGVSTGFLMSLITNLRSNYRNLTLLVCLCIIIGIYSMRMNLFHKNTR